ncbi:MAG: Regulatory protein GntR HTH [Candidatus Magnetoglobus multicellularis str. Araruama]|uniref:Regulatory protein GntR HTH n=1 Tax=Candidatus Magnetoglobus multicellularis str. Araruama TaxID=890399 RepID=A0A1V1PHU1_9BACT|nr:MAG: Regulatory protein GntR HTH [Candidatus Magnetoglobus multicellularis str. Araruama]
MNTPFTPVEKVKASEQIVEMLIKYILEGGIRSGEKLPPERTLATEFNVNRTTLREALKKLEQLKLISIRQGQGAIVEDLYNASIEIVFYLLNVKENIDLAILENILEARELFGTDVARLAAKRADEKDIAQMQCLMEKLVQAKDPAKLQLLDFELFRLLSLASKNMVYILLMNMLKTIHEKQLHLFLPLSSQIDTSIQQALFEAVKNKDEAKAAQMARQFLNAGREILKFFQP